MRNPLRFHFTFNGLLWALTLLAAIPLLGYPLARNLYASYTWDKVPCWYAAETRTWYFERDGQRYATSHPNFWGGLSVPADRTIAAPMGRPYDSFCYVSRGQPYEAVHNLDTHKDYDHALPRVAILIVIAGAVAILTFATRKTNTVRHPPPRENPPRA